MNPIQRFPHPLAVILRMAFITLAVALARPCRANPDFLIDVWTPYEGLPQSHVLSIAQTPDGYLWVATQLGWLARFDGIRFTPFNAENTAALISPEIQTLLVDDLGTLWIGDIDGRVVSYSNDVFESKTTALPGYDKRIVSWLGREGNESRFATASGFLLRIGEKTVYERDTAIPLSGEGSIREFFCQDGSGRIWCRTLGGLLGIWENSRFQRQVPPGSPENKVNLLLATPEGEILMATQEGVWRIRGETFEPEFEGIAGLPEDERRIYQIAAGPDGDHWLLGPNTVMLMRDGGVFSKTRLEGIGDSAKVRPLELHVDSGGNAWVVKAGVGLWRIAPDGRLTVLSMANGLPSALVDAWFEDREGNIWLGTAGGLVRLKPRWFHLVGTNSQGPGAGVVSVAEDADGSMWLGRMNGLSHWKDGTTKNVPLPPVRPDFPIAEVTLCPGEAPGKVWIGTVQSGAMLLRDGKVGHPFPPLAPGLAIRVIRKRPDGSIWFGGEFGLFRWNGKDLRKFGPADGLTPGHIHDICFDSEGTPWIGKAGDLLMVYRDGRFQPVPLPGIASNLRINAVLCGKSGTIWIGTVGGGLLQVSQGKAHLHTSDDGLPGNSVTQLLEDDEGYLWGGTPRGIFRASISGLEMRSEGVGSAMLFQTYDHSDGLPTAECPGGLQPACWKASDGKLWFSTSASAVFVDPAKVIKNIHPPSVILEQMKVNERPIPLEGATASRKNRTMPPGRHRYEFFFTGLSFTAPEKVRFQWSMRGVDNGWVEGGGQRSVAYSGLGPGNYQFEVRACNNDGIWSTSPARVAFRVDPHFWQRPSVWLASVLASLGLVALFISNVMHRRHRREVRHLEYERSLEQQRFSHKQAMETERARIAAELHDDLGANLTQIQWLGEAANRAHVPASGESELLLRISRKSREMVRLIDEIVWAVNPKNDTLEQLVTYVCNFAEQYFRDSETRCRIDVADDIPACPLKADVRHHLFLIAKEALHNVAKHAATDRVWIRVTCADGIFKLVIEDRGRGFDTAPEEGCDGLVNMRRRAHQAGVGLNIHSAVGQGTRVSLVLNLPPDTP